MATILNIDTSGPICSVALARDGEILVGLESSTKMDHSTSLAPFIKKCFDYLEEHKESLDAVSVANGPGSYTGLRIGLSMAKGIAFGKDIPLITLSTLDIMAVRAIFNYHDFEGDELILPMIDARRMEVYTSILNSALDRVLPEQNMILDENSLKDLKHNSKIIIIGDGSEKFQKISKIENAIWLGSKMSHAKYMVTLSEKYYREKKFSDVAYTVPNYIKEYQTTQSKNRL